MNITEDIRTPATAEADSPDTRTHLWDIIRGVKFAMFTTRDANGQLHSRPVTTQNSRLDEDANLWFFMARPGEPVAELCNDPVVGVVYADPGRDRYVSVSGSAAVVDNMAKKQQLWSKRAEAYFPKGVNDPDLALVQVRIVDASYWDVKESKLVQLYAMAKAVITGKPAGDLGEHAEIRMR